jgi:hypothetical protein
MKNTKSILQIQIKFIMDNIQTIRLLMLVTPKLVRISLSNFVLYGKLS